MTAEKREYCAFCNRNALLVESHVLPAFIFRWLRETSATGHIRFGENPNKRVQDGMKYPWLCADCEGLFNKFETPFATNIFYPWNEDSARTLFYGEWLLKFCVSVSWRVLKHFSELNGLSAFSDEAKEAAKNALTVWSRFLVGEIPHPSRFEQHILPFDPIDSHTIAKLPNNMNRYLLRSVEMDLPYSRDSAFTYAKMGRFALFGFICPPTEKWDGTKIHVKHGRIGPRRYTLPQNLLGYLMERAENSARIKERISDRQYEKIESQVIHNIDKIRSSETFRAMMHDRRLFGDEALIRIKKRGDPEVE